jgi:hypothetical protein
MSPSHDRKFLLELVGGEPPLSVFTLILSALLI